MGVPQASNWFRTVWDEEVTHAYQVGADPAWRAAFRFRNVVNEEARKFLIMGTVTSKPSVPGSDVVGINPDQQTVTLTTDEFEVPFYIPRRDLNQMSADERREFAKAAGMGIGRREKQICINALEASPSTLSIAKTIGSSNAMNNAKVREALSLASQKGWPAEGRHIAVPSKALPQLLGDDKLSNFDYSSIRRMEQGEIGVKWAGFTWHIVSDMREGGIVAANNVYNPGSLGANEARFYVWHQMVGCFGLKSIVPGDMDWIPNKRSWLVYSSIDAGATTAEHTSITETYGVIKGLFDDSIVVA